MMDERSDVTGSVTFGAVFVVIGVLVLLNEFEIVEMSWAYLLPIVLIVAGIGVIVASQFGKGRTE